LNMENTKKLSYASRNYVICIARSPCAMISKQDLYSRH